MPPALVNKYHMKLKMNFTLREKGVFTNSPPYNNDNIANFILAVLLEMNKGNEVCILEKLILFVPTDIVFHIHLHHMVLIKKKTANIRESKVGINAITLYWQFCAFVKTPIRRISFCVIRSS